MWKEKNPNDSGAAVIVIIAQRLEAGVCYGHRRRRRVCQPQTATLTVNQMFFSPSWLLRAAKSCDPPPNPEGTAPVGVEHNSVTGAESDLIWDLRAWQVTAVMLEP